MLGILTFILITASPSTPPSPFSFEVKRGFVLEPFLGSLVYDKDDPWGLLSGLRLSYLFANHSDAFVTWELSASSDSIFTGSGKTPRVNYAAEGALFFYEIFNPAAVRLGFGAGAEYRSHTHYRPMIFYRGGLGWYFGSSFSLWVDLAQRGVFRSTSSYRIPIELSLSTQFVF